MYHTKEQSPLMTTTNHTKEAIYQRVARKELTVAEARQLLTDVALQPFALSAGQQALWLVQALEPDSASYNVPMAFQLSADVSPSKLEAALNVARQTHAALQTTFQADDEDVWQQFSTTALTISQVEVSDTTQLSGQLAASARKPFDLMTDGVMRVTLFNVPDAPPVLLITVHHIVFDGISMQIFLETVQRAYDGLDIRPNAAPYNEFVAWQADMLSSMNGEQHRAYWLAQLDGNCPPLQLPTQTAKEQSDGATHYATLPKALATQAAHFCQQMAISPFALHLSVYKLLLAMMGRVDESWIATPMSGRPQSRFEQTVGYFMNLVVIRSHIEQAQSFRAFVEAVSDRTLDALEHSDYPFLNLRRDLPGKALFQAAFYFQNWIADIERGQQATTTALFDQRLSTIHQQGEFDLTFEVIEGEDGVQLHFKYNAQRYDARLIAELCERYVVLLENVLADPDRPINDISLLTTAEQQQILCDWNETQHPYPVEKTPLDLISAQRQTRATAPAVIDQHATVDYETLIARANQLANYLVEQGVQPGDRVGVLLPRSAELLVALLAIWRAGAAYVPLDPIYPTERLSYMLTDSAAKVVLTVTETTASLPSEARVIHLDQQQAEIAQRASQFDKTLVSAEQLAYVIYTSGSTGKPKGVAVTQRNLMNFLVAMRDGLGFSADDHLLALTTICFDISILELFLPLICGGRVELLPEAITQQPFELKDQIEQTAATFVQATPATWSMLLAAKWYKRRDFTLLCGGESLSAALAAELLARAGVVWNMYGPTETTIWSSMWRVQPDTKVLIGRPIANTQLYILDPDGRPLPTGAVGELFIGGDGVAAGYLNRPELSAERFLTDPFKVNNRIYRTGDLARYLPDGTVECLGRADQQVKIRGYRIEPEEIESCFKTQCNLDAVVVVRQSQDHKRLTAFVRTAEHLATEQVKATLERTLPNYMVPSTLVAVVEFPMTLNKKVDRKTLATQPLAELRQRYGVSQATSTKQQPNASVRQEIAHLIVTAGELESAELHPDVNLGDYGFDSILFTRLSSALNDRFGLEIRPNLFYQYTTLRQLSDYLQSQINKSRRSEQIGGAVSASAEQPPTTEPIAIVGMAARMPQSADLAEFWQQLDAGADLITEIPPARWSWQENYDPSIRSENGTISKWGGFMPQVNRFEADFFGISPREAALMDPQQRLVLETAWQAVESAGHAMSELSGSKTGVFIGVSGCDFMAQSNDAIDPYTLTGIARSVLANRISYLFNLHGASEPVDTACSSSLVAVHRAIAAIHSGECSMALAGGVNVMLDSFAHVASSKVGMLSPDGHCKPFDQSADGYVRSEGVGMVLLKPLSQAIADGNPIMAVIRGSAVNHGGRANSLTAPNPNAQADLLLSAYTQAQVDPRTVTYIETHGTGTALGDPIEVDGLRAAFQRLYEQWGYPVPTEPSCALGSVKANAGHLEAAAGIAGLIKTVLSLQHQRITPIPHLTQLNPAIDLSDSPFHISADGQSWAAIADEQGQPLPRRAGVSSFGFGGANAHVILEEWVTTSADCSTQDTATIIPLSAHDEPHLLAVAAQLDDFLSEHDIPLHDLAYTLQVGRDALRTRVAFVASSIGEVRQQLQKIAAGERDGAWWHTLPRRWVATETVTAGLGIDALAQAWVNGAVVAWETLYATRPQRRTLPVYPFGAQLSDAPALVAAASDEADFQLTLDPEAWYLADHIVQQQRLLPGVAYLELVRATYAATADRPINVIQNVLWAAPYIWRTENDTLAIQYQPTKNGAVSYKVLSGATTHAVGNLASEPTENRQIDLKPVRQRLTRQLSRAECYRRFQQNQFDYGKSLRVIEQVEFGQDELLARLSLQPDQVQSATTFVLHPAIMDGALQCAALLLGEARRDSAEEMSAFPFGIDMARQLRPIDAVSYVHVQQRPQQAKNLFKYDVIIMDEDGNVSVELHGYTIRAAQPPASSDNIALYKVDWQADEQAGTTTDFGTSWVIDSNDGLFNALGASNMRLLQPDAPLPLDAPLPERVIVNWATHTDPESWETALAHSVNLFVNIGQAFLQQRANKPLQLLFTYRNGMETAALYRALSGFLRSVAQENPLISGKTIGCDVAESAEIAAILRREAALDGVEVRYRAGQREVFRVVDEPVTARRAVRYRPNAVTLITGGAGGLGEIFAQHIARQTQGTVVLCGRRASVSVDLLARVAENGGEAHYIQADITDRAETEQLIATIQQRFGQLNGVIHAAGVLHDAFLLRQEPAAMASVLAPKITGTRNLLNATDGLDYFALFGSTSATFGNAGQSAYAYANQFMSAIADEREQVVCFNWSYWANGGMRVPDAVSAELHRRTGVLPLETAAGRHIFDRGIGDNIANLLPLQGDLDRIRQMIDKPPSTETTQRVEKPSTSASLRKETENYLLDLLAKTTQQPRHRLDASEPLEHYGVDSVMIITLNAELEEQFGSLSKTLFFEYQTIAELSDYFVANHAAQLRDLLTLPEETTPLPPVQEPPVKPLRVIDVSPRVNPTPEQTDIAVIGMSGRYPMANNLAEFWENLSTGRNCVTEIPRERWDYRKYYDPQKGTRGKTYAFWGGFLDDIDKFDPLFFNISPLEAEMLDPQERLFLQTVWHTIEDAGYTRNSLGQYHVGVYVGVMWGQYQLYGGEMEDGIIITPTSSYASIANRVSYTFNFRGPSIGLDTMCSSSLTTIHLACESIRNGETEMAVAGGVNLTVHPNKHVFLSQTKFLSTEGLCRSFGADGDGYVPGEGVGALLLKPLSLAIRDGDQIHAVIKSTAINHGGKTNGYTVPNPREQQNVIRTALDRANIDPDTIGYIEAHGTGTALGDPIEMSGLSSVFRPNSPRPIGSVKSNIGHCESAAGIAGITKTILQLKHRQLVPSIHADELNPNIDWSRSPFFVQRTLSDWEPLTIEGEVMPRRAGVSSFGAGGANAHVILEEYQPQDVTSRAERPTVVVLSAKDETQLRQYADALHGYLASSATDRPTSPSVIASLTEHIASLAYLPVAEIDETIPLAELNLDWLQINQLLQKIRDQFGVDVVSPYELAEQTISSLAEMLMQALPMPVVSAPTVNLNDLAFTLQTGREAMDVRLAIVVDSVDKLRDGLRQFADGADSSANLFFGNVKKADGSLSLLLNGAEGQQFLRQIIANRRFERIAQLWVSGVDISWEQFADAHARRISLPVYPFKQQSLWVPETKTVQVNVAQSADALERYFYQPQWVESSVEQQPVPSHAVIVYQPDAEQFALDLDARIENSLRIRIDDEATEDNFQERLSLLESLETVYFITAHSHGSARNDEAFAATQESSVMALLRLIHALDKTGHLDSAVDLRIVTHNLHHTGEHPPYAASMIGLARSASREIRSLQVKLFDLQTTDVNHALDLVTMTKQMATSQTHAPELIVTDDTLLSRALLPQTVEATTERAIRSNGVYWVIGGTGNVGSILCDYLARTANARLLVTGRRPINDAIREQIARVEQLGGEMVYVSADLTDLASMTQARQTAEQQWGAINGVIHSAMFFEYQPVKQLSLEKLRRELAPKSAGIVVLESLFAADDLDFMLFFSSGESFTGNVGWGSYAAGCTFSDAYARYLDRTLPYPVQVINWGFWQSADAERAKHIEQFKARGIYPLQSEDGMEALERVLAHRLPQAMVLNVADHILERMGVTLSANATTQPQYEPAVSKTEAVIGDGTIEELTDQYVKSVFGRILKIEPTVIDSDSDFTEYGVDSLVVTEIHAGFEHDLGKLPVTVIIENTTAHELAEHLLAQHREALEGFFYGNGIPQKSNAEPRTPAAVVAGAHVLNRIDRVDLLDYMEEYGRRYQAKTLASLLESATPLASLDTLQAQPDTLFHLVFDMETGKKAELFVIGQGDPILFIPAIGLSAPVWSKQMIDWSKDHQLIVIHQQGYGLTDVAKDISFERVVGQFVEVLERLGIEEPLHVIGSCFGGVAAQYMAKSYPDYVRSLTLCGTFSENFGLPDIPVDQLTIEQMQEGAKMIGAGIDRDFDAVIEHSVSGDTVELERCRQLLMQSQCVSPLVVMRYITQILTLQANEWLPQIQAPTLCIAGTVDTIVDPAVSRWIASEIPAARFVSVENAAHYPFLTHPQVFQREVLSFIENVDRPMIMAGA